MGRYKWKAKQQRAMIDENHDLYKSWSWGWDRDSGGCFIGLDFSLTSTGVVVLDEAGELLYNNSIETSAKDGTTAQRLNKIVEELDKVFYKYPPLVVAWETINVGTNIKSTIDLARVSGAMFRVMYDNAQDREHPPPYCLMCNVSTLKKALSGSGEASKGKMLLKVHVKWGEELNTDDEADAYIAAKLASKLDVFWEQYERAKERNEETMYRFLLDLVKMRNDEFNEVCAESGIDEAMLESMLKIFTGSQGGGSGLNQLRENDKDFYYEARTRLKEV